jgi:DNA-binding transcriptional MerR regulator
MHIGKISELTGATRKAIRHYEAIGLIPVPERLGKYRVYTDRDVVLIWMIKRAQAVGFTLSELTELLAYKAKHNKFSLDIARDLINKKRDELNKEMARITKQNEDLNELQQEIIAAFSSSVTAENECRAINA